MSGTEAEAAAGVAEMALAEQLRPLLLHINRHLRREIEPLGLSASQLTLLAVVSKHPGLGPKDLAEHEGMTAPSMCGHLDRLEGAGLVVRSRDSVDRRRVGVETTETGERALRSARRRRTAWLAGRIQRLDASQREALADAVEALTQLAEWS